MGLLTAVRSSVRDGNLEFHASVRFEGLDPDPASPRLFQAWLADLLRDWGPFENLATAHNGILRGGASGRLGQLLEQSAPFFESMAAFKAAAVAQATAAAASEARQAGDARARAERSAEMNKWFDGGLKGRGAWADGMKDDDDCDCG